MSLLLLFHPAAAADVTVTARLADRPGCRVDITDLAAGAALLSDRGTGLVALSDGRVALVRLTDGAVLEILTLDNAP